MQTNLEINGTSAVIHARLVAVPGMRRLSPLAMLLADPVLRVLLLAMALSHLLDIVTTTIALYTTGSEANPLSAWVIAHFGLAGLALEKISIACFTAWNMATLPRRPAIVAGVLTTLVTGAVVAWNCLGGIG